jgi:hypothetical protein
MKLVRGKEHLPAELTLGCWIAKNGIYAVQGE